MKKRIILAIVLIVSCFLLASCNQALRVSENLSKEADNFNIQRRLSVINIRTDKPVFEMIGNLSIQNTTTNELAVIVQTAPGQYKKHYVYLNDWTMYVVEDITGTSVSPYHYEINFLPEMIIPISFTQSY